MNPLRMSPFAKSIDDINSYVLQKNRIKFGIFLSLQLISMGFFARTLPTFFTRPQLRKSVSFHVVFLLLFFSSIFVTCALSLSEAYMFNSEVWPQSELFCSLWNWFHYSLNIINLFLMAFASIERNILIFHPRLFRTRRVLIILHYCPIIFCIFYPPLFYFGAIFLCPCENAYDYTQLLCTWPCYFFSPIWANIDLFFNNYTPLLIIPLFCSIVYFRVLFHRRSMQMQTVKWRRDKKLILQLLAISSLYLAMWMPTQIIGLITLFWNPTFLNEQEMDYICLFPYLIHLVYPIIVLFIITPTRHHLPRVENLKIRPIGH